MPIIGGRQASVRGLGFQGAGAPAQVTGLTATNLGSGRAFNNGRIDLSWTAPANNGAPITGYFIERSTNGSTYSTLVANTANTNVSYSDTGLTSAQQYWYRVSAINAVGTGLASTAANATATTVPQAPTIGTATAGNAQATVTYTANATGGSAITGFTATSSPGSLTGTGASPITVTGLSNGTAYTFTVTATNANGTSAASAASNSVTPVLPGQYDSIATANLAGVTTVTISNIPTNYSHLVLRWTSVASAQTTATYRMNLSTAIYRGVSTLSMSDNTTLQQLDNPGNYFSAGRLSGNHATGSIIYMPNYALTNQKRTGLSYFGGKDTGQLNGVGFQAGLVDTTTATTSVTFATTGAQFTGTNASLSVYGIL